MTIKFDEIGNPILTTLADHRRQQYERELQERLDAISPGLNPATGSAIAASLEEESKRIADRVRVQFMSQPIEFTISVDEKR